MARARLEVTYDDEAPLWKEIERIADERHVKRQDVLALILQEWFALKHGRPLTAESLWGISRSPYTMVNGPAPPPDDDAPHEGAAALADSFM